jgi:hypothetical protein
VRGQPQPPRAPPPAARPRLATSPRPAPPPRRSEGGFFKAELKFPDDFPNSPPVMRFTTPMWHPNSERHKYTRPA